MSILAEQMDHYARVKRRLNGYRKLGPVEAAPKTEIRLIRDTASGRTTLKLVESDQPKQIIRTLDGIPPIETDLWLEVRSFLNGPPPPFLCACLFELITNVFRRRNKKTAPGRVIRIQKLVADYFGVSRDDYLGRHRNQKHVWPRQIAIYLADRLTPCSSVEIGRIFRRDHTTILHAVRKIEERRVTDPKLNTDIEALIKMANGGN